MEKDTKEDRHLSMLSVFVAAYAALAVHGACGREAQISRQISQIDAKLPRLELIVKDTTGNGRPESYYEHNGQRLYVKIDEKPVEEYFKR